jgi:preprotein translocase subunit YajC
VFVMSSNLIVAQDASGGGSALAFLLPLLILGGLFYVLLILPQRRRQRRMEQMRSDIGVGDEVRTIGGILGTIVDEEDDVVVLDIGGQRMRVVKRAIAERIGGDES